MKSHPVLLVSLEDVTGTELGLSLDLEPEVVMSLVGEGQPGLRIMSSLTGELSLKGNEGYLRVLGDFAVEVSLECYRCLTPFTGPVLATVNEFLKLDGQPPSEDEQADGCLETIEGCVNLDGLLNELFWLAWPHRHLCRPQCAGLCSRCGTDLNYEPCSCPADSWKGA